MKTLLLCLTMLFTVVCSGQKKLRMVLSQSFDENGFNYKTDSLVYIYNDYQGSLTKYKPIFQAEYGKQKFNLPQNPLLFDTLLTYSTNSGNMMLFDKYIQTKSGDKIMVGYPHNSYIKYLYSYDNSGNLISETKKILTNGLWITLDSIAMTYDDNNKQLTQSNFKLLSSGVLQIIKDYKYSYNPLSNMITESVWREFNFNSDDMEITRKFTYNNSGSKIIDSDEYVASNVSNLKWLHHTNFTYSGSNLTQSKEYLVIFWIIQHFNPKCTFYTYNFDNNLTEEVKYQSYDTLEVKTFEYLDTNFISASKIYKPNSSGTLYLATANFYFYQNTLSVQKSSISDLQVYPNPTKDILTVECSSKIENIQILNLNGQVLLSQGSNKVDINHLPAGTYFVKGNTATGSFSKKIVKE